MQLKELCKACGVTKKAVEYYEAHDLLRPDIAPNGYRSYSDKHIAALREIATLRRLGIGVSDIGEILRSENKAAQIIRCKSFAQIRQEKLAVAQRGMDLLIEQYDLTRVQKCLESSADLTVREKLLLAFPGTYGVFLCLHFGRFLNVSADTGDKKAALEAIVAYLDSLEQPAFPEELRELLDEAFSGLDESKLSELSDSMVHAVGDADGFLRQMREPVEAYLAYRQSEEYRVSPAYRLRELLLAFEAQSGYREKFLSNLIILSPDYRSYVDRLNEANKALLERYPQARDLQ